MLANLSHDTRVSSAGSSCSFLRACSPRFSAGCSSPAQEWSSHLPSFGPWTFAFRNRPLHTCTRNMGSPLQPSKAFPSFKSHSESTHQAYLFPKKPFSEHVVIHQPFFRANAPHSPAPPAAARSCTLIFLTSQFSYVRARRWHLSSFLLFFFLSYLFTIPLRLR